MSHTFFTSESVTAGHPDKVCDQISDAVLDAILAQDPTGRVACECACTTGLVLVMGEITTTGYVDIPKLVRGVIEDIGYKNGASGFDGKTCAVLTAIDGQSPDIAMGVDRLGAGDQGMMFGYACDETAEFMPLTISLAHKLTNQLTKVRDEGILPYLRPDGKSQVTVQFGEDGKPQRVDAVVISSQHTADTDMEQLRADIIREVIKPIIPAKFLDENTKYHINPTGRFVTGGPEGDSGVTGRKIIVDTYGGYGRHGGGAFSGKDPTKVDRSAAYAARWAAKNIVAAGLAKKIEIELAYAIGVEEPLSVFVESFGTSEYTNAQLADIINEVFDFRPASIIKDLDLRRPIYQQVAAGGHFGRDDLDVPWEKLNRIAQLQKAANCVE
ncbi:MAG: methionine adenosyltransferase [Oscillospiraceae bacterium]|nr:methionine adenosyltransferase [Oscillospiraceae bacterium]